MTTTLPEIILRKRFKKTLTKKNMENWLKSKSPKTKVGISRHPATCPLFKFLKQHGFPIRGVTATHVYLMHPINDNYTITINSIPKWVTNFIRYIDRNKHMTPLSVSAKSALKCLKQS